jgi:hypothetical protein
MSTNTCAAPESYATFWEPVVAPPPVPVLVPAADAADAYLVFTNATEGTSADRD